MARLDIRLSDEEKAQLQSAADQAGKTLSEFVRDEIIRQEGDDRFAQLDSRIGRLEEMAGL